MALIGSASADEYVLLRADAAVWASMDAPEALYRESSKHVAGQPLEVRSARWIADHEGWTEVQLASGDPCSRPLAAPLPDGLVVFVSETARVPVVAEKLEHQEGALELRALPGVPAMRRDEGLRLWSGVLQVVVQSELETAFHYTAPPSALERPSATHRGAGRLGSETAWARVEGQVAMDGERGTAVSRCLEASGPWLEGSLDPIEGGVAGGVEGGVIGGMLGGGVVAHWAVPEGSALSWPNGRPAGTALDALKLVPEGGLRGESACGKGPGGIVLCAEGDGVAWVEASAPRRVMHASELKLVRRVDPRHPGIPGEHRCRVEVDIDVRGRPESVRGSECPDPFAQAAEEAVLLWRWRPVRLQGEAAAARTRVTVRFQTSD